MERTIVYNPAPEIGRIESIRTDTEGDFSGLPVATVRTNDGALVDVVDHSGCVLDKDGEELKGCKIWGTRQVWMSVQSNTQAEEHWCATDRECVYSDKA